jgi:hypothetical protein
MTKSWSLDGGCQLRVEWRLWKASDSLTGVAVIFVSSVLDDIGSKSVECPLSMASNDRFEGFLSSNGSGNRNKLNVDSPSINYARMRVICNALIKVYVSSYQQLLWIRVIAFASFLGKGVTQENTFDNLMV